MVLCLAQGVSVFLSEWYVWFYGGARLFPLYQQKPKLFDKLFFLVRNCRGFDIEKEHLRPFVNARAHFLLGCEVASRSAALLTPWFHEKPGTLISTGRELSMSMGTKPTQTLSFLLSICMRTNRMWLERVKASEQLLFF